MKFLEGRTTLEGLEHLKTAVNAEHNPVAYLAIDPGVSNGVCGYDAKYYLQFMYSIHEGDLAEFLDLFEFVDKCIIEDFVLYPNKAQHQTYSDMPTSRVIGRIEDWGRRKKIDVIKQKATVKTTGYKWANKQPLPKSNPMNHALDAHIHFIYWAVKNGRMDARALLK